VGEGEDGGIARVKAVMKAKSRGTAPHIYRVTAARVTTAAGWAAARATAMTSQPSAPEMAGVIMAAVS